jgi:hypothetical protein
LGQLIHPFETTKFCTRMGMAVVPHAPRRTISRRTPVRKIPDALIYEIMDGKPIYRKGYKDVLAGRKTLEEIMGASSLQALIVSYLNGLLWQYFDAEYFVLTGEPGVHINHRDNLSNDVAIYDQAVLTPDKISKNYADVPALVALEVDIEADHSETSETGYLHRKTRKLLQFGTRRVIWVLTEARVVMVATAERTEVFDWDRDIEVMDGHAFNIGAYLAKKGVVLP